MIISHVYVQDPQTNHQNRVYVFDVIVDGMISNGVIPVQGDDLEFPAQQGTGSDKYTIIKRRISKDENDVVLVIIVILA